MGDALHALSLFYAGTLATAEGKALLPDSILKIRDQADARKTAQARKLIADFLALNDAKGCERWSGNS